LCLALVEPLKIHLRKTSRHHHWSPSVYLQVNLPVIGKAARSAIIDMGRTAAGPITSAVRVETTLDRLQITLGQAAERYSRHRVHRPAARSLPPLRQELVRPAPVAAETKRTETRRPSDEPWSRLVNPAPLPPIRPELSLDINRITDQVIRKIDRRIIAARERLGRI
jgi:hypothetical protein